MVGVLKKISINIDEAILTRLDKESQKLYWQYYSRLQRSKGLSYIIRWYFANNKG